MAFSGKEGGKREGLFTRIVLQPCLAAVMFDEAECRALQC